MVNQDLQVPRAVLEPLDRLDRLDRLAQVDLQDLLGPLDHRAQQELRVVPDRQERQGDRVHLVL